MSEDEPSPRIELPSPLMVVGAVAVSLVLGAIFLLPTRRVARSAVLPTAATPRAPSLVTTTLSELTTAGTVVGDLGSPGPVDAVASTPNEPVNPANSTIRSLGTPAAPIGPVLSLPISALPVLSAPAPLVLGDVVNQGPQTTARLPKSVSATTIGVVSARAVRTSSST
ncbi:MAG: hypothetical protein ACRDVW_01790 [Acidimicrobiales bacterium]